MLSNSVKALKKEKLIITSLCILLSIIFLVGCNKQNSINSNTIITSQNENESLSVKNSNLNEKEHNSEEKNNKVVKEKKASTEGNSSQDITQNGTFTNLGLNKFDDVRITNSYNPDYKNPSIFNLKDAGDILPTLTFDESTKWPEKSKMPKEISPQELIEKAKNPGLGIRELHKEGITGKGVNVAVIDQPTYLTHPEFKGKIVHYEDFDCKTSSSMHGAAVASLLVGESIGVAPGAKLYYAAAPSWLKDSKYFSDALNWIIEENKKLPKEEKIRLVSVSSAPSGEGSPFNKNNELWDQSVKKAEEEGLFVLDCTSDRGFIYPSFLDIKDMENVSKCTPGFPSHPFTAPSLKLKGTYFNNDSLFVPVCPRTTAEILGTTDFSYAYWGQSGVSWAIPYASGVLALGWQVRPELTSDEMIGLLLDSAYKKDTFKIIDPKAFIKAVKNYKK